MTKDETTILQDANGLSADRTLRICIIPGTVRPGNYTRMAADVVAGALAEREDVTVDMVDVEHLRLSFPGQTPSTDDAVQLRKRVADASALVLATPEYHGGFSSFLKLVIENLGFPSTLQGKPVALVGVAAGSIGAIKSLEQLRSVCAHVGALVLPGPISIDRVRNKFTPDGECTDELSRQLLEDVADKLLGYMKQYVCPRYALEALVRGDTVATS